MSRCPLTAGRHAAWSLVCQHLYGGLNGVRQEASLSYVLDEDLASVKCGPELTFYESDEYAC